MKFDARPVRMLSSPPLKLPRDTSYGVVTSDVVSSRRAGCSPPPKFMPLSVVAFWSAPRPSTEKPAGLPSALGDELHAGQRRGQRREIAQLVGGHEAGVDRAARVPLMSGLRVVARRPFRAPR